MNYLVLILVLCLVAYLCTPLILQCVLRFLLRKFQFRADALGMFTYGDVMLRIPWTLNVAVLIRIEMIRLLPK